VLQQIDKYNMVVGALTKSLETVWYRDIANVVCNHLISFMAAFKVEYLTSSLVLCKI
jgi:hypothetical protein